ncbi:30S ribosomal protein S26e [Sulfolobus sp. A20]|uniref:30S ribosomal protein S26e n=1 Tax=Sulfolobaceae TaxID=118883 RepID=UPI000845C37D|nr:MULTISPECIES: 30S ribosomal protein S26e [unclassified Sulfolobus]TRM78590.1 30S ribosomal protein S26e [Sulfolobus sp. A20-N-F8]TRM78880.1 30S ribosomal protein S26e [Sulfolobus sp. B5]TRM80316.1 30S ribosomal protein S26e [Sulfolobus sp. D5]TRM87684.1 30S ribosomal protein S26e [Sulfolobus sp. C3]TRM92786.1 30S ribosomal protein S26e [Sulfolobus sp. A20-N-G8]TRN02479.1 30S ribosomal protein S26e [Sulfolobus sp. E1]TRN03920.1 30S ribosomal protein S26e [Sulfolobus sp. F1]
MPKKRENRGRRKGDKGHVGYVSCDQCGARVPEDKAVCVTKMYSPVDPSLASELEKKGAIIARYPVTKCYCINCAVFLGIVRIRAEDERKQRAKLF